MPDMENCMFTEMSFVKQSLQNLYNMLIISYI